MKRKRRFPELYSHFDRWQVSPVSRSNLFSLANDVTQTSLFPCKTWQVWSVVFPQVCDGFLWNLAYLLNLARSIDLWGLNFVDMRNMKTLLLSLRDIARDRHQVTRLFYCAHSFKRNQNGGRSRNWLYPDLTGNLQMFSRNWTQPARSLAIVKVKLRSV